MHTLLHIYFDLYYVDHMHLNMFISKMRYINVVHCHYHSLRQLLHRGCKDQQSSLSGQSESRQVYKYIHVSDFTVREA